MNQNIICYVLGRLVLAEAVILGIPFFMALYGWEKSAPAFAVSICICVLIGLVLRVHGRSGNEQLTMREGAAITGLGWLLATFLGMLPYLLSGSLGFLDGLFESISGFTGTGATVMTSIESQPFSILFWRMMTHWFGGLGIIVIFIALLPQAGQSTVYMYNAETTGPTRDRVLPRLREMSRERADLEARVAEGLDGLHAHRIDEVHGDQRHGRREDHEVGLELRVVSQHARSLFPDAVVEAEVAARDVYGVVLGDGAFVVALVNPVSATPRAVHDAVIEFLGEVLLPVIGQDGSYYTNAQMAADGWNCGTPSNPLAIAATTAQGLKESRSWGVNMSTYLAIKPIKDLTLKSQFSYRLNTSTYREMTKIHATGTEVATQDGAKQQMNTSSNITWENTIAYDLKLNDHALNVVIGNSIEQARYGMSLEASSKNNLFGNDWDRAYISDISLLCKSSP